MRPVLITTGATRNPIDSMRYISAHASGRTGAWLAEKLQSATDVHVLCSPEASQRLSDSVSQEIFGSTDDLMKRMEQWLNAHPNSVTIHSAAVGDYALAAEAEDKKIASGQDSLTLTLKPTPKILDHIQLWANQGYIVSFKAASPDTSMKDLETIARAQAIRSKSALVFANIIGKTDGEVMLVDEHGHMPFSNRIDGLQALYERVLSMCTY